MLNKDGIVKSIDGKDYKFYQYPATEGLKIWIKLVKIVGSPIGTIVNSLASGDIKNIKKIDAGKISLDKAVKLLAENLDEDDTVNFIKRILQQVTCNGKRVDGMFDIHFQKQYMHLFKVVYAALEVNYKDFLSEIAGSAGFIIK